ncbi:hypothetical protein FB451DRAFT_1387111 [Mycena latifolia]|nr:hypothetical protein FB451DRAFT_1387111 [Mycena latifolia]
MSSEHSESSLPFLRQSGSSFGSARYEKLRDPEPLGAQPVLTQRGRQAFLWKPLVICGQLLLQSFARGFFAIVERRGFIVLPYLVADAARENPHLVTLCSTLISTGLAACVSRSVALYLREPMSLGAFVSTVNISARSLVLDPQKRKWSAISMGVLVLTGVQTSGWSTLLTPVGIVIETPVTGSEIDLASPLLSEMQSSGALDYCLYNSSLLTAFSMGQTESGYALAKDHMGFPASFTLMDQTFNISTGGILPATGNNVSAGTWFPYMTVIPSTLQGLDALPDALAANYSMSQQGFSADVTCAYQELGADTTPSIRLLSDTVKDWNTLNVPMNISYFQFDTDCPVPENSALNWTYAFTAGVPNYLIMIACGPADNYTLIFESAGLYDAPITVCSLSPKIGKVKVDYTDPWSSAGTIGTTGDSNSSVRDPDGPAGLAAVTTISYMVWFAQAIETNVMAAELHSVLTEVEPDFMDQTKLLLTEKYIRGVAEYSGSVFRACLSGMNGTFPDGVPTNMTIAMNGTIYSQTVGWSHASASTIWVLIPGALVALATIIVVVVAVAEHAGDPASDVFEPSSVMHLVAVAAAGGLSDAFTGMSEQEIQAAERVNVVLGSIPGRGPALIRTEAVRRRYA